MKFKIVRHAKGVLLSLPDVFNVQPETDYQILISHSANEVASKAWERTGTQLRQAFKTIEKRHPNVKRKLTAAA